MRRPFESCETFVLIVCFFNKRFLFCVFERKLNFIYDMHASRLGRTNIGLPFVLRIRIILSVNVPHIRNAIRDPNSHVSGITDMFIFGDDTQI